MKIKDRLALYFTLISTTLLLAVLSAVYFIFIRFMQTEFFSRLTERTMVTAKLYLEADEISIDSLNKVREQYLEKLSSEVIRIYNDKNKPAFIGDAQQYWPAQIIEKVRLNKRIQFKEGDAQVVGIYYKDNQGDFVILASAIDYGTIRRVEKLRKIMVVIFFIIFLGLLFSARWIAKRILLPLDLFIDQVKLIKSNNLHFRVDEGRNKDEVTLLAQNFNNLMGHLENAFILQKTFVANASHELRTPITRMIIGAEISLSQERSKEDYQKALTAVVEDAERMEDIISGLMVLAQTDIEYGASHVEKIRIDELLWALQKQWLMKGEVYRLLVEMKELPADEELLIITANPALLQIALDNIISNAFKFSDIKPVRCMLHVDRDGIRISVADEGIGIDEQSEELIFQPFFSSSSKAEHAGKGMGLYMAHKIISLYHGKISVSSEKGKGTRFELLFPQF